MERALGMDEGSLALTQDIAELEDWDSMAVLEFQAIADEEFGLQIDPTSLETVKTVGDLWNRVSENLQA